MPVYVCGACTNLKILNSAILIDKKLLNLRVEDEVNPSSSAYQWHCSCESFDSKVLTEFIKVV